MSVVDHHWKGNWAKDREMVGGKTMSVVDEIIDQKIKSYIEEIAALKRQNAMLKQEISNLKVKGVKD